MKESHPNIAITLNAHSSQHNGHYQQSTAAHHQQDLPSVPNAIAIAIADEVQLIFRLIARITAFIRVFSKFSI